MFFHPKIAISQNKDERLCKEHELEGVSSLILDYETVRMNADRLYLSRLSNGPMESLSRIAKDLKRQDLGLAFFAVCELILFAVWNIILAECVNCKATLRRDSNGIFINKTNIRKMGNYREKNTSPLQGRSYSRCCEDWLILGNPSRR